MKQNPGSTGAAPGFALPDECRKAAENLFPPCGGPPRHDLEAAAGFAKALGIGGEYLRLLKTERNIEEMHKFLGHFQNNLDLLIQKTWVEKTDEARKEKLQKKVPAFVALIVHGDFVRGVEEFSAILDELAYLLFGEQSCDHDFTEYTFRVDIEMGLFWWYGSKLGGLGKKTEANDEFLWALLLIGICYLTNF